MNTVQRILSSPASYALQNERITELGAEKLKNFESSILEGQRCSASCELNFSASQRPGPRGVSRESRGNLSPISVRIDRPACYEAAELGSHSYGPG